MISQALALEAWQSRRFAISINYQQQSGASGPPTQIEAPERELDTGAQPHRVVTDISVSATWATGRGTQCLVDLSGIRSLAWSRAPSRQIRGSGPFGWPRTLLRGTSATQLVTRSLSRARL